MSKLNREIEQIVKEFSALHSKRRLSTHEAARVKRLMIRLREMGFTNPEIQDLTGDRWSEPTIKLYTRGTKIKDENPKKRVTQLLSEFIGRDMTIKDVEDSITMRRNIESKRLTVNEVTDFLDETRKSKIDLTELFQTYKDLKRSALTLHQIKETLSYKTELESAGLTLDRLRIIQQDSKKLGGYEQFSKAIKAYDNLRALTDEVEKLERKNLTLEERKVQLTKEIDKLEKSRKKIEDPLNLYNRLEKEGFDEKTLKELQKTSKKYGGSKKVLETLNTYKKIEDLKQENTSLSQKKRNIESDLKKTEADHAHLTTIIEMSRTLLYKHKFSIPAITDIYESAKRYDEPFKVLKAINTYGELKRIEDENKKFSTTNKDLQKRKEELETELQKLRGSINELVESVEGSITILSKNIEQLPKSVNQAYLESINNIRDRSLEAGRTLGEAEEKIRRTKYLTALTALIEKPSELEIDYDTLNDISLALIRGLQTFIKINKDRIRNSHELEEKIERLSEELTERARHAARKPQ